MRFTDYRSLEEIACTWAKEAQAPGNQVRLYRLMVQAICDGAFFDDGLAVRAHALMRATDPNGETYDSSRKGAQIQPNGSMKAVAKERLSDFELVYDQRVLHGYLAAPESIPAAASDDPEVFFDWLKHTDPSDQGSTVRRLFDHVVINRRAFRNWCQFAGRAAPGFVADWPDSRPLDPNHRGALPLPETDLISLCEAVTWLTTGRARPAAVLKRLMLRHRGRRWPRGLWRELEQDAETLVSALRRGDVTAYGQHDGGPHVSVPLDYFKSDVFAEFALDVIAPDPLAFERGTYPDGLPTYRSVRFERNELWGTLRREVRSASSASLDGGDALHAWWRDSTASGAFSASHWNLLQVLAWIYLADRRLVEEAGLPGTGIIRSKLVEMPDGSAPLVELPDYPPNVMMLIRDDEHPGRRYASLSDATESLISELAAGRVAAIGLRNNQGDPSQIPHEFWIDARFTHEPETACSRDLFRPGASRWFALRFPREQVLAVWPEEHSLARIEISTSTPRLSFLVLARRWIAEQSSTGLTPEDVAVDLVRAAEDGVFASKPLDPPASSATYDPRLKLIIHTVDQYGEPQDPHWIRNYVKTGKGGGEHGRRLNAARDLLVDLTAVSIWLRTEAGELWLHVRGLRAPRFLDPPAKIREKAEGSGGPATPTYPDPNACLQWLLDLMADDAPKTMKRDDCLEQAKQQFGVGGRLFEASWRKAIETSGNKAWSKPGPIRQH